MILLTIDIGPPHIHATMSKLKIPMLPQLRAPITVKIRAILSINITKNLKIILVGDPHFARKKRADIIFVFFCGFIQNAVFQKFAVYSSSFFFDDFLNILLLNKMIFKTMKNATSMPSVSTVLVAARIAKNISGRPKTIAGKF